ncbi:MULTISPECIES: ImmA/IrrE family metallo-endopeptidase [Nocardiaceae]|uniref:ImmA/IrrE family metallo-endopeptidase n=1 Tax=Nocardiaceae TaxID=85025 RepID=UPI00056D0D7A|nr:MULTISPECIES: hypothetical protein [Rhodococcus]
MTRSHRRISAAVDVVCEIAADADRSTLDGVIEAIARERRRPIVIEGSVLPPGVCGQRRAYPDRDVIVIGTDLPNYDRTLAHELGHIVFRHDGIPIESSLRAVSDELLAYLLSERTLQSAVVDGADNDDEWEAEAFAGQLLQRLRRANTRGAARSIVSFDQALG